VTLRVLGADITGDVPVKPSFEVIVSPADVAILERGGVLLAANVSEALRIAVR